MMDRGDILYAAGALLTSVGAGLVYAPAFLICLGSWLALPALLSMLRTRGPGP